MVIETIGHTGVSLTNNDNQSEQLFFLPQLSEVNHNRYNNTPLREQRSSYVIPLDELPYQLANHPTFYPHPGFYSMVDLEPPVENTDIAKYFEENQPLPFELSFTPELLSAAIKDYQRKLGLNVRPENFNISLTKIQTLLPTALSIVNLENIIGLENNLYNPQIFSGDTQDQYAGIYFHEALPIFSATMDFILDNRPLELSLPSNQDIENQLLLDAIAAALFKVNDINTQTITQLLTQVWGNYYSSKLNQREDLTNTAPLITKLHDQYKQGTHSLASRFWLNLTNERKSRRAKKFEAGTIYGHGHRHEVKSRLYLPAIGLTLFSIIDDMALEYEIAPVDDPQAPLPLKKRTRLNVSVADFKSRETVFSQTDSHPFSRDAHLIALMAGMLTAYEYTQKIIDHSQTGTPFVTNPKDYPWLTRSQVKPPSSRHHVSGSYWQAGFSEEGSVNFQKYTLTPTRRDWQRFMVTISLLGQLFRTIPSNELKAKAKAITHHSFFEETNNPQTSYPPSKHEIPY